MEGCAVVRRYQPRCNHCPLEVLTKQVRGWELSSSMSFFMFLLFRTLWFFMFFMFFKYRKYLYCVFSFKFIYVDYTVSQILVRCCHLADKYCNVITMTEYCMGWLFKLKSKYWNYLPGFSLNIHTSIQSL